MALSTKTRRRESYWEAAFWAAQLPLIVILPQQTLIKYLAFLSIYAIVRTCIAGGQADTPD